MPNGKNKFRAIDVNLTPNLRLTLKQDASDLVDVMMIKAPPPLFSLLQYPIYTNAHKLRRIQAAQTHAPARPPACTRTHKGYPFPLEALTHIQHQSMACLHRSIRFASGYGLHVCLPYHPEPLEQGTTALVYIRCFETILLTAGIRVFQLKSPRYWENAFLCLPFSSL